MTEKEMFEIIKELAECNKDSCKDCKIICTYYSAITSFCEKVLPEDSVVLSKEEYSEYLILQNNFTNAKEKCEKLQADNERLYNNLGKFKESIRKEMAKEIFEKIKIKVMCEDIAEDRPQTLYRFTCFDIMKMAREVVEDFGVSFENGHAIAKQ